MRTFQRIAHIALMTLAGLLAACGGSSDPPPPAEGSATIGAAGGFVDGPDGVRLGIPPGALAADTTFRIARNGDGAPPLPDGIELASAVYAVTPHGQSFDVSSSIELPVSAAMAAGRPSFLMKAEPGGRWSVIGFGAATATRLRAGIDSLSYLAVGVCQNNLPPSSPFGQACPSANQLTLELLLNGTTPVPISQDTTYGAPIPVVLVTTPETLTFRLTWTRPAGTNRIDLLDSGSAFTGNTLLRQAGITFASAAPRSLAVNENNFSRTFTVDVDPSRVSGASGSNGVVRRIWAQAAYGVTGPGNIGSADWEFSAWVPIQVRALTTLPVIATQPTDAGVVEGQGASFTVAASGGTLSYQWSRRANASAAFAPIAGATAAGYAIAATQLADNGAQFQVEVCAGASRCVTSSIATVTVTQAPIAPSFSTSASDLAVVAGQTASFNAVATGMPLPQIKWQQASAGSTAFTDITGVAACGTTHPSAGATNVAATCTVGPLAVGDSGQRYRAVAVNAAVPGGVPSDFATVTVSASSMAPVITSQPASQLTTVGSSATFSVAANGTAPLNYGWTLNGSALPAGGSFTIGSCVGSVGYSNGGATVTLFGVTAGCQGASIAVTVSNGVNPNASSVGAGLTVNPAPTTAGLCFASNSAWCYAKPLPQANGFNGLAYRDATFTAVGGAGTTLRSGDNGNTWQPAFEAGRSNFFDVASPAPGLLVAAGMPAIALGQNSGVFTSTDGGQNWTRRLDAGVPGIIAVSKLAFADATVGLAAGFRGVWRTVDGGLNWASVNLPSADFVVSTNSGGVAWADSNTVLIYGGQGTILRSVDAGLNWTDVSVAGLTATYNDMAFNTVGVGIAVGPNGQVARSTDLGATWQALATGMSDPGTAVAFADDNTVVAMGNLTEVMRSTDAGQTWSVGFLGDTGSSLYRLRFANASVGLAVSAIAGQVLRTVDGGQTWARIAGGTFDEMVTGMAASPSGSVVLAGSLGRSLLRSTTAGATWALTNVSYQRPSFGTEQLAIAIRPSGQIARSTDAGQTWSVVYSQLGLVTLENTTMASANVGLVVGQSGLILRSSDGGVSWNPVVSGTTSGLRAVGCLTATVCVAAGGFIDGGLLRSTDGGATWAALPSPVSGLGTTVRAIKRFSDSVAVIAADNGLWRSADAGLTWTRVYSALGGSQLGVSFSGAGIGIAVGYDGILRSADQGLTWARQNVPISFTLFSVTWINANTVLVGGDGGAILRNLQAGAE